MRITVAIACAALLAVPVALGSREDGFYRRPHVPLQWEQHRAVALLVKRRAPVYCGAGRSNAVALTFDDGPGPYTAQLLRELRAAGAHATFFVVGNRIRYWPREVRNETSLGAVGNHSFSHPRLVDLPGWLVWLELVRTQWDVRERLGWKPRLVRPPYARRDADVERVVHGIGLLEVMWSVDSRDWVPGATTRSVIRNVVAGLRPGAIVLMHDIHPWTVAAVPEILRAVRLRHLRAVSVPELLALDSPRPWTRCPVSPLSAP